MTSPGVRPEPVPGDGGAAGEPAVPAGARREPVPPEQSREDTDAGWGEYPDRDDERLYRDRPPHWDDL
jgi:hypothetical protein